MKKIISLGFLLIVPCITQSTTLKSFNKLPAIGLSTLEKNPYTIAALASSIVAGTSWYYLNDYEERWDWEKITIGDLIFPSEFKWGSASSDLQISGVQTAHNQKIQNNWTNYEDKKNIPEEKRMGIACGHWDRYKNDFALAKDFGLQVFRYSIEWSKIQPHKNDEFDEDAMQHYIDYTKALIDAGLEPMPTLFHHAWPLWFDELGAFEKAENIEYFVQFALYVFEAFKKAGLLEHTKLWLTFNEPAGYAAGAYIDGRYPPNKKYAVLQCGTVLKNMLDAHCEIYKKFKEIDQTVQISLAHAAVPVQPYNPWNPLDHTAKIFNYLVNTVTLEYLSSGNFVWLCSFTKTNPNAKNTLDFIGVNYYSHTLISWFKEKNRPFEISADLVEGKRGKTLYAEGFYYALKNVAHYFPNLPIFITESGFATDNVENRKLYIDRHLYVLKKLIDEGMHIMGYLWWTFLDCYSWNKGNGSKHGIFHVDFTDANLPRTLKESSIHLKDVIAHNKEWHAHNC